MGYHPETRLVHGMAVDRMQAKRIDAEMRKLAKASGKFSAGDLDGAMAAHEILDDLGFDALVMAGEGAHGATDDPVWFAKHNDVESYAFGVEIGCGGSLADAILAGPTPEAKALWEAVGAPMLAGAGIRGEPKLLTVSQIL